MIDFTPTQPPDRYGLPGVNYPTSCPTDLIIIVEDPLQQGTFQAMPIGTRHQKVTEARLTWQGPAKGNGNDVNVRRIYANPRLAQEPYNLLDGDNEAKDPAFPIFIRSYLLPKDFTPGTMSTPLTAVIGLDVTTPGTTALPDGRYALSFSGTGTGAAGIFQVINGTIAWVALTNSGTGYTAAPTVTAPSTTGATITAALQPESCVLTDEVVTKAEEMMEGWFYRVRRTWETLPGRTTQTTRIDEDGVVVTVSRTKKAIANITSGETLVSGTWTRTTKQNAYGLSPDGSRDTRAIAGNAIYAEEVVETRAIPGQVINSSRFDVNTETIVAETKQLVAESASDPSITNLFVDYRTVAHPDSVLVKWQEQTIYPSGVTSQIITEYEADNFTYPALMSQLIGEAATKLNGDVILKVTPLIEAERPRLIAKKVVKTFTTTSPTESVILSGLYPIEPFRHRYDGIFFRVETGPVLQDGPNDIEYITGTDDPTWGNGVDEKYSWAATVPGYTSYTNSRAAGEWKQFSPTIAKKLAAGLWMLTAVSLPVL